MKLDRRNFLQQAGLALFTWGVTEAGLLSLDRHSRLATLVKNYQQALAEPTNRKLALLVGINHYPHNQNLNGCLTDIELQRELLIHRFGFQPQDILTLSDREATRENIETAFIEHLGKQAQTEDVVLFHFSGYGRQVKMPLTSEITAANAEQAAAFKLVNSYVPVDGVLPAQKATVANNILQDSLLALAQSLSTTRCTFVLDTSFNSGSHQQHGSFKVRSTPEIADSLSSEELIFLAKLHSNFAAKGLKPTKRLLSLPGVVLSASSNNQIAVERQWDDFSAGLFTYALTQHLWQITPSRKMQVALARTAATVEQVMGKRQQPALNNPEKSAIAYYLATSDAPQATGVISKVHNNNSVEIKLLGLSPILLDCYGINSCLGMVTARDSTVSPLLQIHAKEGLASKAKLLTGKSVVPIEGQLVVESMRMLRRDLGLNIALDGDMQRIERVDATSALANTSGVNSTVVSGEQSADCLLGKVEHNSVETTEDEARILQTGSSYGLYTPGGVLIGKTTGLEDEAVKVAIARLQPQLGNLLAAKWLELTNNEFTSSLSVSANLSSLNPEQSVSLLRSTSTFTEKEPAAKKSLLGNSRYSLNANTARTEIVPALTKSTDIQLALVNNSDRDLYAIILGIDADSNIFALYTPAKSQPVEAPTTVQGGEYQDRCSNIFSNS